MRDILPEKISKSQNLPQKISKSQKGLQGNSSGGSQKNLKKSQKVRICLKKSQKVRICLKKSQKVTFLSKKKSQKVRLGISCGTFLQHSCRSYVQGGLQLRYLSCNTAVHHMIRWVAVAVPFLHHSCPS